MFLRRGLCYRKVHTRRRNGAPCVQIKCFSSPFSVIIRRTRYIPDAIQSWTRRTVRNEEEQDDDRAEVIPPGQSRGTNLVIDRAMLVGPVAPAVQMPSFVLFSCSGRHSAEDPLRWKVQWGSSRGRRKSVSFPFDSR